MRPAIYDGDTPREARADIRRQANIVLTNPDMLHVGILPNHPAWAELFANLAIVVIDEAHVYRGVFGSHVANVLRRLRRIAAAYGTTPRFLLTSATIANPLELAERLTGLRGREPDRRGRLAGAGSADRDLEPAADRRGAGHTALGARARRLKLLARLVREQARVICFMKSRKGVELLHKLLVEDLEDTDPELAELVAPYRAGYTSQQRRELEGRLHRGELRAVITTDALELGIDIGELDAAVVVTFPGTVASLRQMWGRAGRRGRGLAVYVAGEDALDQFFCRHPDDFLRAPRRGGDPRPREPADPPRSPAVRGARGPPLRRGRRASRPALGGPRRDPARHAASCAAAATRPRAIRPPRRRRLPGRRGLAALGLPRALRDRRRRLRRAARHRPSAARAHSTVHEGAIYLHLGRTYEVRELDLERRRALVAPFDGDWYTQPKRETDTDDRAPARPPRARSGSRSRFGEVAVTETVLAYQRRRLADHAQIDLVALDLPPTSFSTQALWFELDAGGCSPRRIPLEALLGALHATEHAQIAVLPLIAMCDRWDIGGLSTNLHPQTGGPTIFIYDGHPGGIGITRTALRPLRGARAATPTA